MTFRAQWTKPGAVFPEHHDFAYRQPAEDWADMCRAAGYAWVRVDEVGGDADSEGATGPRTAEQGLARVVGPSEGEA